MSDIKFSCSACGQHMICDAEFIGRETTCPDCQFAITVPFESRSGPPPIPKATHPVPNTLEAYGALVIGFNCLCLLFTGINLLRFATAMEGPFLALLAILAGGPSITLGVLGIRLGRGLQRGERLAVVGTFVVSGLELIVWWLAVGVAFEHPIAVSWRLSCVLAVALLFLPLAFSAKRNWPRLH